LTTGNTKNGYSRPKAAIQNDTPCVTVYYRHTKNKFNFQGKNMSDKSRRKLLKSIAAGGGAVMAGKSLPESWARPIVDSVVLPAHAQTSGIATYAGSNTVSRAMNGPSSVFAKISDSLINTANAGSCSALLEISYCIKAAVGATVATVQVILTVEDRCSICEDPSFAESAMTAEFTVPMNGSPVLIPEPVEYGCEEGPHIEPDTPPTIAINPPSGGMITGVTTWEGEEADSFNIPVGTCATHIRVCRDEGCAPE
jgi:hypothetical protein